MWPLSVVLCTVFTGQPSCQVMIQPVLSPIFQYIWILIELKCVGRQVQSYSWNPFCEISDVPIFCSLLKRFPGGKELLIIGFKWLPILRTAILNRGHLAMAGDRFGHDPLGLCRSESEMLLHILWCTGQLPQQGVTWSTCQKGPKWRSSPSVSDLIQDILFLTSLCCRPCWRLIAC